MSIFKGTFSDAIKAQINKRQDIISKRDAKSIQSINSRNAWIRMTSSVDVDNNKAIAKKNVLLGGALLNNTSLKFGVGTSDAEAYSTKTSQGNDHRLGIRPMPGITSLDVTSKGAYGSIREVTVKFTCWDIRQLEELELLYMRPGFSVLVEWGWMPYIDNNGTLQGAPKFIDDVLEGQGPKEKIWKEIYKKSSNDSTTAGNYDAAYGYIRQYSWESRPDGGYDCTTVILTMGEMIESLKVNYTASDTDIAEKGMFGKLSNVDFFKKGGAINSGYTKNVLAGMVNELWFTAMQGSDGEIENKKSKTIELLGEKYDFFRFKLDIENKEDKGNREIQQNNNIYITLESFVRLLNKHILIHDKSSSKPLVEVSVKEGAHNSGKEGNMLLCSANIYQLSTDPTICQIKNMKYTDPAQLGFGAAGDYSTLIDIMNGLDKDRDYFKGEFGVIGNIYVNLEYLYTIAVSDGMAAKDPKEQKDISLYDYLKEVLKGVNTAIGNVANFDIIVDPVDSIAKIVDINYIDEMKRIDVWTNLSKSEIQLHNTKSIVRSYKLESKIFPEQSSMMAIGAQSEGGALASDTNTMSDFNKEIKDRIVPRKEAPPLPNDNVSNDKATALKNKIENLKTNLDLIVSYINKLDPDWYLLEFIGDYDVSQSTKYANALRDIINFFKTVVADDNKNRAIIPTVLSLEMDGIGGIVQGNMFKIPDDILPKGYKGTEVGSKIAYTVTGISHTIQNNDWTTKIEAQFTLLDDPTGKSLSEWLAIAGRKVNPSSQAPPAIGSLSISLSTNPLLGTTQFRTILNDAKKKNEEIARNAASAASSGTGTGDTGTGTGTGTGTETGEILVLPPASGDRLANLDKMRIAANKVFNRNGGKSGLCALYTYSIASCFKNTVLGKNDNGALIGNMGNADMKLYRDNLQKLGYKMTSLGIITYSALTQFAADYTKFRIGDIINYRNVSRDDGKKGLPRCCGKPCNPYCYGHTQIYIDTALFPNNTTNRYKWASSVKDNYGGTSVVYSASGNWEAYYFQSPV